MNPQARKRKPIGTRVSLGGGNKAAQKVNRRNKPIDRSSSQKAQRVNARRESKAIKKGNVKEVSKTVQVSPASSKIVVPQRSLTTFKKEFRSSEERAGDFAGQKERAKGVAAPKADAKGNFGQQLQAAIAQGRKNKQTSITFRGKRYKTGENVTTSTTKNFPAIRKAIPAVTKTVTSKIPQFKRFVDKQKKNKSKKVSTSRAVNARVVKVKNTIQ